MNLAVSKWLKDKGNTYQDFFGDRQNNYTVNKIVFLLYVSTLETESRGESRFLESNISET